MYVLPNFELRNNREINRIEVGIESRWNFMFVFVLCVCGYVYIRVYYPILSLKATAFCEETDSKWLLKLWRNGYIHKHLIYIRMYKLRVLGCEWIYVCITQFWAYKQLWKLKWVFIEMEFKCFYLCVFVCVCVVSFNFESPNGSSANPPICWAWKQLHIKQTPNGLLKSWRYGYTHRNIRPN